MRWQKDLLDSRSLSGNDANLASPSYSIVVPGYVIYHQVAHREVSWLDRSLGPRGRGSDLGGAAPAGRNNSGSVGGAVRAPVQLQ